jgi:hypothetical protein
VCKRIVACDPSPGIEALNFGWGNGRLVDELRIERLPGSIVREANFRGASGRLSKRTGEFYVVDIPALPIVKYRRIVRIEDSQQIRRLQDSADA